jgi:hypothetical protein
VGHRKRLSLDVHETGSSPLLDHYTSAP